MFCISCEDLDFRILVGSECHCKNAYYNEGTIKACQPCSSKCLTCIDASTKCLTCEIAYQRELSRTTCICKMGWYDSGPPLCSECLYSCKECVISK